MRTRRALLAGAAALVALPAAAAAQDERSDVDILEDLLALEARLLAAYEAALRRDAIEPALGELLIEQERKHARALEQTLRDLGRRSPRASVPSPELTRATRSPRAFAEFAHRLEGEATGAYGEAVAAITKPGLRQPLGSIMASEAAHVVAIRESAGFPLVNPLR